jgi:hypothetical protein
MRHRSGIGLATVCALAVALAVPAATAAAAKPLEIRFFQTPSKRIHCAYSSSPANLRCDVDGGLRPRPERPAWCHVDWAQGLYLGRSGKARVVCAGDTTSYPAARVVAYGETWSRGGFRCEVRRRGLTCENRAGRGFFLSTSSWRRF